MDPLPPLGLDVPRPLIPPDPPGARRTFSWRDFSIGLVAGIAVVVLLVAGFVTLASKMAGFSNRLREAALPAPDLPPQGRHEAYGQADMNWTFQTLAGAPVTLADYRGKVIFLNFWATWCGPCVAEMPSIQKLHDRLNNDNVAFILVSDEDVPKIEQFLQDNPLRNKPLTLPVFRAPGAPPSLFRTPAIPATFVIDTSGLVVLREIGATRWNHDSMLTFLRGLLAGQASGRTSGGPIPRSVDQRRMAVHSRYLERP